MSQGREQHKKDRSGVKILVFGFALFFQSLNFTTYFGYRVNCLIYLNLSVFCELGSKKCLVTALHEI